MPKKLKKQKITKTTALPQTLRSASSRTVVSFLGWVGVVSLMIIWFEVRLFNSAISGANFLLGVIMMSWLVALLLQFSEAESQKLAKIFRFLVSMTLIAFLINIFLRFLDVYSLDTQPTVINLCSHVPVMCRVISSLFFRLKLFRFVTLSTIFFAEFLLLFGGLFLFTKDEYWRSKIKNTLREDIFKGAIIICVIFLFLTQCVVVADRMTELMQRAWRSRDLSFADRFVPLEYGTENQGWIWPYTQFLNKHIPESATIFIPPQSDVWPQEGNADYLRWFIYPRKTVQSTDPSAALPTEANFVLVSRGGWNGGAGGWPKIHIPEEKIAHVFLINRQTLEEKKVTPQAYYQDVSYDWWGVMELK